MPLLDVKVLCESDVGDHYLRVEIISKTNHQAVAQSI